MTDFWQMCLQANRFMAVVAASAVCYRLAGMGMDLWFEHRSRAGCDARTLHLFAWFCYVVGGLLVTAFGARYYAAGPTPANWISGFRTMLLMVAIALSMWWPHPTRHGRPA